MGISSQYFNFLTMLEVRSDPENLGNDKACKNTHFIGWEKKTARLEFIARWEDKFFFLRNLAFWGSRIAQIDLSERKKLFASSFCVLMI